MKRPCHPIQESGGDCSTRKFKKEPFSKHKKNGKSKIKWMIIFLLIRSPSRYLCSNESEEFPIEIIPRGMVGIHPRSPRVPKVHHRMKTSFQALARTVKMTAHDQRLRRRNTTHRHSQEGKVRTKLLHSRKFQKDGQKTGHWQETNNLRETRGLRESRNRETEGRKLKKHRKRMGKPK
jgi:hypothetical protein